MRTSSGAKPRDAVAARNAFFLNQLATPGLGSLLAGRTAAGLGQIGLAVAGFALVLTWFVLNMNQVYQQIFNDAPAKSYGWVGAAGGGVFAAAWLWALGTSLSLLRGARRLADAAPNKTPPRIDEA